MKIVEIKDVSYRYPQREEYALRGLNLTIGSGEFILVTGSSGSGKSTLCRLLNGLVPRYYGGALSGSVFVDGLNTDDHTVGELSTHVGLVFQDPENQMLMSTVEDEIAFGLENQMMGGREIGERIDWVADKLGIKHLLGRPTSELSGGEKQKVVLASVLALKPKVIVLDEPTSQLDPDSRSELFRLLTGLNREGAAILVVEHNIDEILSRVDWVFDLDSMQKVKPKRKHARPRRRRARPTGDVVLRVDGLCGGYGGGQVLADMDLEVRGGECLAVTGRNGSGKTTLVKHFNGLLKPTSGSVFAYGMDTRETPTEVLAKRIAYLTQNPSDMLFCDTVEDELKLTLSHLGVEGDIEGILDRFGLTAYRSSYPRDLSVGEKQRTALAAVLVSNPDLVVLDEPTRGIDERSRETLVAIIRQLLVEGKTVVVVTQDTRLVSQLASREVKLEGGRVEA
jgi:energy-coupling factor transporter ATP-binding protein EcfA2